MILNTTPEVDAIGQIHFEGNIIPPTWYKHIKTEKGKADFISITILSDIVYWYRPTHIRDEISGNLIKIQKKFAGYALQKSKKDLAEQFGISEGQVKDSLARLEKLGLIKREFRTISTEYGPVGNVQFILVVPEKIQQITYPRSNTPPSKKTPPYAEKSPEGGGKKRGVIPKIPIGGDQDSSPPHIYTEITPETTISNIDEAKASDVDFSSSDVKFSEEIQDLYKTMISLIQAIKPDFKLNAKSSQQMMMFIDYMLRLDSRNPQTIIDVFSWALYDAFWSSKLFKPNPAKYLREKFDQLEMQMRSNNVSAKTQSGNYPKSAYESGVGQSKEPRFRPQRTLEG